DQMLLRLIDAIAQRQAAPIAAPPVPSLTELIAAVGTIQKMQTAPAAPPPSFSEKLLERAFNMATKGPQEDAGSGNDVFDFIKEVWREMKPQLVPAAPIATAPSAPAPAAAPAEETTETIIDIEPWINSLKNECRQQRPVEQVADYLLKQAEAS